MYQIKTIKTILIEVMQPANTDGGAPV